METALKLIEKDIKTGLSLNRISHSLGKPATSPDVMKFIHGAMMYIEASSGSKSDITKCSRQSIIDSIINAATVRLPVDNRKLAYLVPYGKTCAFMPGYLGYIYKVKEADPSAEFTVALVYEGDEFSCTRDSGSASFRHVISDPFMDNPAKVKGGYCFIKTDSGSHIELMSSAELIKVKNASKMSSGYIWNTWEIEMQKKSVVRRACKTKFMAAVAELDAFDNKNFHDKPTKEQPKIAAMSPLPVQEAEVIPGSTSSDIPEGDKELGMEIAQEAERQRKEEDNAD